MKPSDLNTQEYESYLAMSWNLKGLQSEVMISILEDEVANLITYIGRGNSLDFPVRDTSYLEQVIKFEAIETMRILLNFGLDVESLTVKGKNLLYLASLYDSESICDLLLKSGASPCLPVASHDKYATPMMLMAEMGGEVGLKYITKYLTMPLLPIETSDSDGRTAMHYACDKRKYDENDIAIINALFEYGANDQQTDKGGMSPVKLIEKEQNTPDEELIIHKSFGIPGFRIRR